MKPRLIRRFALALIALLAFAQASVALAACSMERGEMAQMLNAGDGCSCDADETAAFPPQQANRCVAHCTADLQLSGLTPVLVRSPADVPVLFVPRMKPRFSSNTGLEAAPPGAVPSHVLLHSFLI